MAINAEIRRHLDWLVPPNQIRKAPLNEIDWFVEYCDERVKRYALLIEAIEKLQADLAAANWACEAADTRITNLEAELATYNPIQVKPITVADVLSLDRRLFKENEQS